VGVVTALVEAVVVALALVVAKLVPVAAPAALAVPAVGAVACSVDDVVVVAAGDPPQAATATLATAPPRAISALRRVIADWPRQRKHGT